MQQCRTQRRGQKQCRTEWVRRAVARLARGPRRDAGYLAGHVPPICGGGRVRQFSLGRWELQHVGVVCMMDAAYLAPRAGQMILIPARTGFTFLTEISKRERASVTPYVMNHECMTKLLCYLCNLALASILYSVRDK